MVKSGKLNWHCKGENCLVRRATHCVYRLGALELGAATEAALRAGVVPACSCATPMAQR